VKDLRIYSVDEIQDPLVLMLCHNGQGGVKLAAVNTQGKRVESSSLLTLAANGTVILHKGISKDLELPLDEDGRLKIAGRKEGAAKEFSSEELILIDGMRDGLRLELSRSNSLSAVGKNLLVFEKMIEALNLPMSEDDNEE